MINVCARTCVHLPIKLVKIEKVDEQLLLAISLQPIGSQSLVIKGKIDYDLFAAMNC